MNCSSSKQRDKLVKLHKSVWRECSKSMLQLVQLVVRQYGCGSYCLIYLIFSWMLLVYTVTIRVA